MDQKQQKIEVLQQLIAALDKKDFELDVWKVKTILLIKSIFGSGDEKVTAIENLHYDFSSWALRDTSGGQQGDKIRETARHILEAAIAELSFRQEENKVIEIIKGQLTGNQFEMLRICMEKSSVDSSCLNDFFLKLGAEKSIELLAKIVGEIN